MGRKNSAFTLVELIIVVSIITALALITIAYFRGQLFKGNDAKRKSDINRIQVAVEEYEKDNNCYPLAVSCNPGTSLKPYLEKIPCDPSTKASYYYETDGGVCSKWYRIYTKLENTQDQSIIPGIGPGSAYNFTQGSPNAPEVTGTSNPTTPPSIPTPTPSNFTGYYGFKNGVCVPLTADCSWQYDSNNCNGNSYRSEQECP